MEVTEVGASVTIKRDVGYTPYIKYLQELNGASPPFGTRNNANQEITLWGKAILDEDDDPLECAKGLAEDLRLQIRDIMGLAPVSDVGNSGDNGHDPDTIELVEVKIGIQEDDFS